jgi:hypothetical protein
VLVGEIKEQIRRIENEENEALLEIIKLYYWIHKVFDK